MKTCAIIPTYNNVGTVADVVTRTLKYLPVILVADGPTDGSLEAVQGISDKLQGASDKLHTLTVVSYTPNRGKGYALKRGFQEARRLGYTHVLTIDSDGQHYPEDIPTMLRMSRVLPEAIILGSRGLSHDNMPGKNTFANKFSNFWFAVQTGQKLPDTQTGFRIYPLDRLHGIRWMTNRYEAELLLLVCSSWANTPIVSVPVRVYYPPQDERVSYFRPAKDFTRISILNTLLCVLALVYGLPSRYWRLACYAPLFGLFAWWCNIQLCIYSLFYPSRVKTDLRHKLGVGAARFLSAFPGTLLSVRLAEGATPIDTSSPAIVIANHSSLLDTLLLLSLSDKLVLIGKEWVARNIVFGKIARAMGIITVEEGMENFLPTIRSYIEAGYSVGVFPEGTRTLNGEIGRFHRGAFYMAEELHLPIRPVVLQGFFVGLSKRPFVVGHPRELRATIMPQIAPDDESWGVGYRERTRTIHKKYLDWICDYD